MATAKKKYKLLITAGPTREPIDPVRFISNQSTGTLGYLLAGVAAAKGHDVTLISGPTELEPPKGVKMVRIQTATDMETAVTKHFAKANALIMSAAVSDFRPLQVARQKIKRGGLTGSLRLWQVELIENPDILAEAARTRKATQAVIGFALETEKWLTNAREKLKAKGVDALIATRLYPSKKGKGPFGKDPVDGAILDRDGNADMFEGLTKKQLVNKIIKSVEDILKDRLA